ncbi:MAG: hypothetical protein JW808_12025 [Victivallales bacterium]|nr:hypothetical protein [Victivallales bacterium]
MKKLLLCMVMAMISTGAMAEARYFNLSLTPDIAVYHRTDTIYGVTLSIWGENRQSSLALGIANGTLGQSYGVSLGVLNYADTYTGLQSGLINFTENTDSGFQIGLINIINENKGWFSDLPNSLAPWMILVNWRF